MNYFLFNNVTSSKCLFLNKLKIQTNSLFLNNYSKIQLILSLENITPLMIFHFHRFRLILQPFQSLLTLAAYLLLLINPVSLTHFYPPALFSILGVCFAHESSTHYTVETHGYKICIYIYPHFHSPQYSHYHPVQHC